MSRVFVLALLLAACDRRSQAGANWTLRAPDAGAQSADDKGKGIVGAPVVAPTPDAGVSMGMGDQQPPPADFAAHDAGPEVGPARAEPTPARDAGTDAAGDARACPETGPCD